MTVFTPMTTAYGAGLSDPEDAYVLVQENFARHRLFRHITSDKVSEVWDSGTLNTALFLDISKGEVRNNTWVSEHSYITKSIVLKSTVNGAVLPVAFVRYNTSHVAFILAESIRGFASLRPAKVFPNVRAMSRLSSDHVLLLTVSGELYVFDALGNVEQVYADKNWLESSELGEAKDIEVVSVQTKTSNSYKDALFKILYVDSTGMSLVDINTAQKSGGVQVKAAYSPPSGVTPYKVLTKGDYVFLFGEYFDRVNVVKNTAVIVRKIGSAGPVAQQVKGRSFKPVGDFYLKDTSSSAGYPLPVRGSASCKDSCDAEILGLRQLPQDPGGVPALVVRQGVEEVVYSPSPITTVKPLNSHDFNLVPGSTRKYDKVQYSYSQTQYSQIGSVILYGPGAGTTTTVVSPQSIAVMKDHDAVPGAIGTTLGRAERQAPSGPWQSLGQQLGDALRVGNARSTLDFTPTGNAQEDTATLHHMFLEDLRGVNSRQIRERLVTLEAMSLEDLSFSMQDFVELVNATPRFKFLLQSHLNFRQREALGFFWNYNGIRSHNYIPDESERVSLGQVIAELLRGDESVSRCEPALLGSNAVGAKKVNRSL